MKDEQLSDITGVPGAVFVHASGFIGGRRGLEDGWEGIGHGVGWAHYNTCMKTQGKKNKPPNDDKSDRTIDEHSAKNDRSAY